jgi:hypothetical protein
MPTSEELLELADRRAQKVDLEGKLRHVPSFSDAEEQCETRRSPARGDSRGRAVRAGDIQRQETLVEQIAAAA